MRLELLELSIGPRSTRSIVIMARSRRAWLRSGRDRSRSVELKTNRKEMESKRLSPDKEVAGSKHAELLRNGGSSM